MNGILLEVHLTIFFIQGGITSSDVATKALEARRAKVMGQALAGVPLWQLGPESRHPGVPYIVFPGNKHISFPYQQINNIIFLLNYLATPPMTGNVGDNSALAEVVQNWACPSRSSTKELLLVSSYPPSNSHQGYTSLCIALNT